MEGERVKYGRETMFVSGCGTHGELMFDKRRDNPSQEGQKPTMVSNNIPVPMAPAFRAEFSKRLYQHSMKLLHSSSASAADGRFLSHPAYSHHFHGIPNANHVIYLPLTINTSRTETRPKERHTVSQDYKKKSKMAAYADMNGNGDELDANGKPRTRLPGNRLTPLSKYSREQTDAGESRTTDDIDAQLKRDQTYYSVGSSLSNVSHLQQLYQRSGDGISNLSRDALLDPQLQQSDSPYSLSRSETELSTNPGYFSSGYPEQHTDKSQFDRVFGCYTSIPPSTSAVKKAVRFQSSDDLDFMKTGTHVTGKFTTDAGQEPSIHWPPGSMSKKTARQLSPSKARKMWRKQDEIGTTTRAFVFSYFSVLPRITHNTR